MPVCVRCEILREGCGWHTTVGVVAANVRIGSEWTRSRAKTTTTAASRSSNARGSRSRLRAPGGGGAGCDRLLSESSGTAGGRTYPAKPTRIKAAGRDRWPYARAISSLRHEPLPGRRQCERTACDAPEKSGQRVTVLTDVNLSGVRTLGTCFTPARRRSPDLAETADRRSPESPLFSPWNPLSPQCRIHPAALKPGHYGRSIRYTPPARVANSIFESLAPGADQIAFLPVRPTGRVTD